MELIQVDEINKKFLFYTDSRSSIAWLKKKNISIIKLGKKYFISKQDFNNAIESLILKNNNLPEVINAHMNFYTEYRNAIDNRNKKIEQPYKPTQTENIFLTRLRKNLKEL